TREDGHGKEVPKTGCVQLRVLDIGRTIRHHREPNAAIELGQRDDGVVVAHTRRSHASAEGIVHLAPERARGAAWYAEACERVGPAPCAVRARPFAQANQLRRALRELAEESRRRRDAQCRAVFEPWRPPPHLVGNREYGLAQAIEIELVTGSRLGAGVGERPLVVPT